MFIEKRKQGKKEKFYLIHVYRIGDNVKRISRYLGSDLKEPNLTKLKQRAEKLILQQLKEKDILEFELSKEEIEFYKSYEHKIEINHLQKKVDWDLFTKEFVYNTNAIEGSTVSLTETKELIDKKLPPENADELETLGVAKAIEYIRTTKEKLSLELIKKLHLFCFENTKHFAGELRGVEVVIKDGLGNIVHRGAPSTEVESLLKDLTNWYNKHVNIYPPLLIAALLHNQFENIHPFQDGNGRVGRLLLNYSLLKARYPPINIRLTDRVRYYKTLQAFSKKGDIKPTLRFLISEYKKQYKK